MNKFYIVENIGFDTKFKTDEEIEDLKWKSDNGLGVWSSEGETEDERISKLFDNCLLYTSPSPRDRTRSRMPSSA